MTSEVEEITPLTLRMLCNISCGMNAEDLDAMVAFGEKSAPLLAYRFKGALIALVGFIPQDPNTAYLWMQTTPHTDKHKVVVGLLARRTIALLSKRYPKIIGHCTPGTRSITWLRSLGARFEQQEGKAVMFTIGAAP